jgi:hypothetical protein
LALKQEVKEEEKSIEEIPSKKVKLEKVEAVKAEKKDPVEVEMPKKQKDEKGEIYFDIGRNRRVSLTSFKGSEYINIREFYEDKKSGEMNPGKKGITLKKDEWLKLLTLGKQFEFSE